MKKAFFYCVLIALPFAILEGFFRLLPVSNPPYLLPVSEKEPTVRFQPNVEYLHSIGWNFWLRTRMRTNNFGYNNIVDYRPEDTSPLLVVIGDSFVEGQSVDSGKSAAELLHAGLAGSGRVYSIGISGAPLSQYLAFAEFSRSTFRPNALAFFVNQSDFDESLLKYRSDPRFHYFAEGANGLELRRVDYERSTLKTLLRKSALVRYVMLNVQVGLLPERLRRGRCETDDPSLCAVGSPEALEQRIADAQRAVNYFLDQLPVRSGLGAERVVFVLDAQRPTMYSPQQLKKAENHYYARMRRYFTAQAIARGYEVLDLQPVFLRRYQTDGVRFEFELDHHWNELGNRVVAEELRQSALFRRVFAQAGARH